MTVVSTGLAGCLGDDEEVAGDDTTDEETTPTATERDSPTATTGDAATVQLRTHADLGDILVGPEEFTLYMFDQDTQGAGTSSCHESCADAWPPLTVDAEPAAGENVAAELETFEREDGRRQVAANGWPLYYFASDESPGDTNGQGVNDVWWVLDPAGEPRKAQGTPTPTPTSTQATDEESVGY